MKNTLAISPALGRSLVTSAQAEQSDTPVIIIEGQNIQQVNINVLIDGAKVHAACPNRMDPPTSHILTNNIADIEIINDPFDVENFGTLSGAAKVSTIAPEPRFSGNIDLNLGSWDYQKLAATIQGGKTK
jgi:iron complex outermembrane receptor protein